MIYLDKLSISDVVPYKKAELDLAYKGLTVVKGVNLDAKMKCTSNGSGKSRLLRPIPLLLFKNPILDTGKRSVRSSYTKKSEVRLDFHLTHQAGDFEYSYQCNGGKNFDILRNGKPSKMRTQGYAEQAIQKLIPISEEEYYSLYYLDSRRPSLLQMGKEAARLEFFTQMFRLDDFDNLRRAFTTEMNDLKGEQKSLKEVNAILDRMRGRISINIEMLQRDQLELFTNIQIAEASLDKYRSRLEELRTAMILEPAINRLSELLPRTTDDWVTQVGKHIRSRSSQLRKEIELVREWEQYDEKYLTAKETYSTLSKKIKVIVDRNDLQMDLWSENRDSWTNGITRINDLLAEIKRLQKDSRNDLEEPGYTEEQVTTQLEKVSRFVTTEESSIVNFTRFLELAEHVHESDAQCPLCNSELSGKILLLVEETRSKKKEAKEKIEKYRSKISRLSVYLKNVKEFVRNEEVLASISALRKKLTKISVGVPTSETIESYKQVDELLQRKGEITRPDKPVNTRPSSDEEELRIELDLLTANRRDLELVRDSSELLSIKDVSQERLDKLMAKVSRMHSDVTAMSEKSYSNKSLIDQYTNDQQQIEELEARASDITVRLEDLPVYEMLTEAYSNRGLKRIVVQNIAKRIEDNLNKYSHLLNREQVKYSFVVNPTTIDILADRSTGVSDVCELSGAESRIFNSLIPLSILSMVPEANRLNLLIIDEPLVGMDSTLQDLYVNNFLPSLNTIMPSIFVMEPGDMQYRSDREIIVTKKEGSSTISERK